MSCTLNISLPQGLAFWNMLKILETRQTKYVELNTEQPSLNWPFFPHGCCRGVRHFGFTEKVYGLPCTVRTLLLWKRHHRNVIVGILFTVCHSSGSSPKFKMIVRELLAFMQPNRHETFTALWNPYRRVSSRGRRAQYSSVEKRTAKKNWKQLSAILVLWRKYTDFRAWFAHFYCGSLMGMLFCLRCAIAVEALWRRAASASSI